MKKIVLSLFVAMAACAVMAQDAQKPMILPGAGHINVESLNKKIDLKMDISKLSLSELRVLRNAFAARQGYLFTSSDLRAVFNSTSWYEDLCWKREDENSKMPPIKYSAAETAFINKIKAREDELRKGNLKPASGLVNMDNLINWRNSPPSCAQPWAAMVLPLWTTTTSKSFRSTSATTTPCFPIL